METPDAEQQALDVRALEIMDKLDAFAEWYDPDCRFLVDRGIIEAAKMLVEHGFLSDAERERQCKLRLEARINAVHTRTPAAPTIQEP